MKTADLSADSDSSFESQASFDLTPQPKAQETEELHKRIAFLQSFDFFRNPGLTAAVLLPVAMNMTLLKFRYGEFVQRAGTVPDGMFLIKSGQCVLGLTRVAYREKRYQDIPGSRRPIHDRHPLFSDFDPENSLLNGVKVRDRAFQNERIYVTEDGKQLKNQIAFEDIVSCLLF